MSFARFLAKNMHLNIGEEICTFPCQKFAPLSPLLNGTEFTLWVVKKKKKLHSSSSKQFASFVLLLSNGETGDRSTETNHRISGCTGLLLIEKWIELIPKTIGNRKRDCAWGCARGINTTWESLRIEKHKSGRRSFRSPDWVVLFDLQIFSSGRLTSGKGYPARTQCVRPVIRSDLQWSDAIWPRTHAAGRARAAQIGDCKQSDSYTDMYACAPLSVSVTTQNGGRSLDVLPASRRCDRGSKQS